MTENLLDENLKESPPEVDPTKDYLTELVGPGRKFKDEKELAKGKFESDSYIKILERRLDDYHEEIVDLRKDSNSKVQLADLIKQISERNPSNETPPVNEEHQPAFDPTKLDTLLDEKLHQREMSRQQADNFNMVKDRLIQHYGDNYGSKVLSQIKDLGLTKDDFESMARRQPKVLIRTLGLDKTNERDPFQAPPTSSQRTDSYSKRDDQDRKWSYYKKMKEENPRAWFDRKTAVQMQEDALRLGDKFYDGDFYVKGLH